MNDKKTIHASISDCIYRDVFERIVGGRLRFGQRITEQELAETLGTSRAPVREALKRLAEDRLIVLVPRSRCQVYAPSRKDINEIYDIRQRLEGLALEYAFEHLAPSKLAELREQFEKCLSLSGGRLVRKELKLDAALHTMILDECRSDTLKDLIGKLLARLQVFRAHGTIDEAYARVALRKHIEILDAILARDRKQALALLDQHIDRSRENALITQNWLNSRSSNPRM